MKTKTAELLRVIADIVELDDSPGGPDAPDAPIPSGETIRGKLSSFLDESGLLYLTVVQLVESSGYRASAILDACAGSSDDTGLVVSVRCADNTVIIQLA